MNIDHVDEDGLASGLATLRLWLERDEHGPVLAINDDADPGFIEVRFADDRVFAFAVGDTDPEFASACFAAMAAKFDRLGVVRH